MTILTIEKMHYLTGIQDEPSPLLDSLISVWLGDGALSPDDAPSWTGIYFDAVWLIKRLLPGWWFLTGHTGGGVVEITIEPIPGGSDGHLLDIDGIDPIIRAKAEPEGKHLCVAMVEAAFRARLFAETHCRK